MLVIGGGFGGLECAKSLSRAPVRVTLVDRTNHHLFQPLLYQVAMAGLSPADIAVPIRSVLGRFENTEVRLELSGFVAWLAWSIIHVLHLIGFRNRIVVMIDWAWAYVTYGRGARLITHAPWIGRQEMTERARHRDAG